ncbi:MAG TPA: transglycosylase domain-containing protein, partial [Actinomycetota bacterium]|nr:transglycosylase domain-containing protein [Actinomycetota bacterium]
MLLPLFAGAGAGVNAFRDRLDEAGVGRIAIPRFPERSIIYAADGSELAKVYFDENRRIVHLDNVAPIAQKAVLAIEDDQFYEHGALDFYGLLRAAFTNLASGEIEQGGSTITQQLVKQAILEDPSKTFARKFQEAALAIRLERRYTKDQILELYLNGVYFGNGAYGIGTASETYFRTPPGQLDLSQAALLAGLIQAPGTYDPVENETAALARRNEVIGRMAELGWITEAKAAKAKARPLGLAEDAGPPEQTVEPFFVYYIRNLILENGDGEFEAFGTTYKQRLHTLYQGGLKIYTTLDPEWQEYAQDAVDASPMIPAEKRTPDVSLVSVDARTGAVKAMLSGKNYERDQLDLAWRGARQVGSAFKPITLVAAFLNEFPPGSVYTSKSPLCNLPGWVSASGCVNNAEGGGDRGFMDLWTATENSVNVVFAQLALDVGAEEIVDAAHLMGITVPLDPVPSITLGVEEVPTVDMAAAYATLANDGLRCETFAVSHVDQPDPEDGIGFTPLYEHARDCEQVMKPEIAHLVTAMLERVVTSGTGTSAAIGRPVAGKTGTAQDYTNVYFAGYTPQISTAVWVGFPQGQIPMDAYYGQSVFGGTVAAPIWQDFMSRAVQGMPVEDFEAPPVPARGRVPDVVGLLKGEAQAILVEASFTPVVEEVDSIEPAGTVMTQAPGGGTSAVLGSAVRIEVSNGEGDPITIPRVIGLIEQAAIDRLERLGLVAEVRYVDVNGQNLDGIVVAQSPIGNGDKIVDEGTVVFLDVGRFEDNGNGGGPDPTGPTGQ